MAPKDRNRNLHQAKNAKQDEFYTQLTDIEHELANYKQHFQDKVVYCNCDDPRVSNFFHYFSYNFRHLGLRKLITTCYKNQDMELFSRNDSERAIYLEYEGTQSGDGIPSPEEIGIQQLMGDGDFRSAECIELLKRADIVVTNPPFSLFREYLEQLVKYEKKFLIIGNKNVITYKEPFTLIKQNAMWVGVTPMGKDMTFQVSRTLENELVQTKKQGSAYKIQGGNVMARAQACWFTNLDHKKRHDKLITYKKYNEIQFPAYDNYNAIEVNKTNEIPENFSGAMGVPITFLDKYNPDQFEIIGQTDRDNSSGLRTKIYTKNEVSNPNDLNRAAVIKIGNNYKAVYMRILIKRKQ